MGYDPQMDSADLLRRSSVQLARQSHLAGRWPVVLDGDLAAVDALTGSRQASFAVLRRMARTGQLERVRRGAYVLRDETGVLRVDLFGLVDALTPKPYLITAGRALVAHDLGDQHFRTAVVLVPSLRRDFDWRGDRVHYVLTEPARIWGSHGRKGPSVASPERAILDSFAHRRWGVTLPQSVEALDLALGRWPGFADTLATAAARYRNAAVARRLGLLVAHTAGESAAAPFRPLLGSSKAATPLDPTAERRGPLDSSWGVRINVDLDALIAHRTVG
jgi:predicted transcriptional regulator of viral defense system